MVTADTIDIFCPTSKVLLSDCMEVMQKYPNGYFDLAIVDVPYGINVGKMAYLKERKTTVLQRNGTRLNPRKNSKGYTLKDWDLKPPPQAYFDELRRISKEQIIFGVEYLDWKGLGTGRIRWNKGVPKGSSYKPYEMAYCSVIDYTLVFDLLWSGMFQAKSLASPMIQQGNKKLNEKRIHPCHKPVLLYDMLYHLFGTRGMKVIDTHLGGGSNRIAADKFGIGEFVGIEIDEEYFNKHTERWVEYQQSKSF